MLLIINVKVSHISLSATLLNVQRTQPGSQVASEQAFFFWAENVHQPSHLISFHTSVLIHECCLLSDCDSSTVVLKVSVLFCVLTPSSSSQRAFPYVSMMLGNGTLSYDHEYDGRPTELGGCTAMARNAIYDTFVLVRYSKHRLTVWSWSEGRIDAVYFNAGFFMGNLSDLGWCWWKSSLWKPDIWASDILTVPSLLQLMVDVDGKQEWKDCADITGVRLPTGYFFGASSATGDLSGMNWTEKMQILS